jgi:hypothetical protein
MICLVFKIEKTDLYLDGLEKYKFKFRHLKKNIDSDFNKDFRIVFVLLVFNKNEIYLT